MHTPETPARTESYSPPLEPMDPVEGIKGYIESRELDSEFRESTERKYKTGLGILAYWLELRGISNTNEITGRILAEFQEWRRNVQVVKDYNKGIYSKVVEGNDSPSITQEPISSITLSSNLSIIREFLRYCETIEAVPVDTHTKIVLPNVSEEDEICTNVPEDTWVIAVEETQCKFYRISRQRILFCIIYETAARPGGCQSLDLGDYCPDDRCLKFRNRPDKGTELKNGKAGERNVTISHELNKGIQDYIEHGRIDVVDEYGREPLFSTTKGRAADTTLRRDMYNITRPCALAEPLDFLPTTSCNGPQDGEGCDCSREVTFTARPLRAWSIMNQLDQGVPVEILSDRANVSVPVLKKHYDLRSEERKRLARNDIISELLPGYQ